MAALEFALLAPVFLMVFAGMIDLGSVLYTRFQLDSAVSAAANYAVVNAANVGSTSGPSLATTLASIVGGANGSGWANNTVVVNNGPTATMSAGTTTSSGTAANADACYCPTGSPASWTWGTSVACGTSCTGNGIAGKFVSITASRAFVPLFSGYGFVQNGNITAAAMVQVQ